MSISPRPVQYVAFHPSLRALRGTGTSRSPDRHGPSVTSVGGSTQIPEVTSSFSARGRLLERHGRPGLPEKTR